MANNRMWLRNKATGQTVLLGKYYPSDGWYVFHHAEELKELLQDLFNNHTPTDCRSGGNDWELELEDKDDIPN